MDTNVVLSAMRTSLGVMTSRTEKMGLGLRTGAVLNQNCGICVMTSSVLRNTVAEKVLNEITYFKG
jgi:hypothetical protein